jgi:hypothetical protein
VNVDTRSVQTAAIREKPASYYTPSARQQRFDVHVNHYGYSHPYSWYYQQPVVYVGGGYSPVFWWMMSEWDAERRARWLYHNQNRIEQDAYERGMRDAQVAEHIAKMKAENVAVNSDYVDSEFADDPSAMYTQEHIEAVYNPKVVNHGNTVLVVIVCVAVGAAAIMFMYWLIFLKRWGN